MHAIHITTVTEGPSDRTHQTAINKALAEIIAGLDGPTVSLQHAVTCIDVRGDYATGNGSGWLYSTVILVTY